MSISRYIDRLGRMDALIRRKATGSPKSFAQKLDISVSTLYEYLAVLKDFGAPVSYSRGCRSFVYETAGEFIISFRNRDQIHISSAEDT
ncbi:MAG: HTH domain-containing protein [Bacteroidota bacterium]